MKHVEWYENKISKNMIVGLLLIDDSNTQKSLKRL